MQTKTKEILKENNFGFKKKYGQNFLVNPKIPERISQSVIPELTEDTELCIMEIGAGAGALTVNLAKRYKKVCALEIDESLREPLGELLKDYDNAEVVFADIMKTNVSDFCREHFGDSRVAVCANLPYYITTPILMTLFESGVEFESITVMVQKEVALRICSKPGDSDYGAFTAAINLFSTPKRLFDVGKGNFYPVPKIDSSIVRFIPHKDKFKDVDKLKVQNVIKGSFSQRRKTIYNSLGTYFDDKDSIETALKNAKISPKIRAEDLSVEDYVRLADEIYKICNI